VASGAESFPVAHFYRPDAIAVDQPTTLVHFSASVSSVIMALYKSYYYYYSLLSKSKILQMLKNKWCNLTADVIVVCCIKSVRQWWWS